MNPGAIRCHHMVKINNRNYRKMVADEALVAKKRHRVTQIVTRILFFGTSDDTRHWGMKRSETPTETAFQENFRPFDGMASILLLRSGNNRADKKGACT